MSQQYESVNSFIIKNRIFSNPELAQVFLYVTSMANDSILNCSKRDIEVALNLSERTVRTNLELLKRLGAIFILSSQMKRFCTIKITLVDETQTKRRRNADESCCYCRANCQQATTKRRRNADETQTNPGNGVGMDDATCAGDSNISLKAFKNKKNTKDKEEEKDIYADLAISAKSQNQRSDKYFSGRGKIKITGKCLEQFIEFWNLFNFKNGRSGAVTAWHKLCPMDDETFQAILAGTRAEIERLRRMPADTRRKWAEGWLNERRWEDEALIKSSSPQKRVTFDDLMASFNAPDVTQDENKHHGMDEVPF